MARATVVTFGCIAGFLLLSTSGFPTWATDAGERDTAVSSELAPGPTDPGFEADMVARQRKDETAQRKAAKTRVPKYQPPKLDRPWRTVGGATRGPGGLLPAIAVLAPRDHAGHTLEEQPILYWFISGEATTPVEFTLVDENEIEPLVEVRLTLPSRPGIQTLSLAEYGVTLLTDRRYHWSVALVPDPDHRSKDVIAEAGIRRIEPDDRLSAKLARAGEEETPLLYAEAGLWYDALASVSKLIAADPGNEALRSQRAALLEQVELGLVASVEGKAAPTSSG